MNRVLCLVLVIFAIGLVACAAPTPAAAPATVPLSTATIHKVGTIRMSITGMPNVKDIPRLMAIDSLRDQGYAVTLQSFATSELKPPAMQRGDIEIGDSTSNQAWTAITKGIDIRSVVGQTRITFYFATKQNIRTCGDLDGRPIAFGNRTSVGYVMFEDYIKENCPSSSPEIILISDSSNRIASLMSGNLDGAYLEIEDWLQINRQAPGQFRILIDFGKEFPQVQFGIFTVRNEWSQQNPEIVKDFIRALLIAHRSLAGNSGLLRDEIVKYLSMDSAAAQESANAFTPLNLWDLNGSLTPDNVQHTIDFFVAKSGLLPGTHTNDVADLSYLNAVLDEIGRK